MRFLDVKNFLNAIIDFGENTALTDLTIVDPYQPPLLEAFDIANTASLSEEELEVQFKRRDFIWLQRGAMEKAAKDGLAQGKAEGQMEGKLEAARNMLLDGIPVEMICKYTALSKEVVEHLLAEL